ncbi:Crp/Fnr family transcriptional regulator [Paracoccus sp. (in: a-proteobacteria)]|uniref:Crp/Fnr family transcriptional regulator n=1 Tax=Paracoccus sp. TaxID=267 RepID=UPI0026E0B1A8|nr:Crp/Fnr family transcriptional regulator [Paracoccus sp. (in: a-proteobacteria)]MDO5647865.1 Crp/Fnr family transcriptional regulator [Paracoccus sp. (in: a-proteobacteria)]
MTAITDILRHSVLFSKLPAGLIDRIASFCSIREVSQGETIFVQGEPSDSVFMIARGWVKLYRLTASGAEAVVSVKTRGDSFAEAAAIRGTPYPVSAEAATAAILIRLDAGRLRHMIDTEPRVTHAMLSNCFLKLQEFVVDIEQLKARSGAQRVAEFLLDLSNEQDDAAAIELPYNKVLIAGRLGMKPESLSRAFRRLRDHGVRIDGANAFISDRAALMDFVAEDPSLSWSKN